MKSVRWMVSYILVASLGLWLAFAVSVKFMSPAHSQEAPASGELPADFLKEVEGTQVPEQGASNEVKSADKLQDAPPTEPTSVPTVPPPPAQAETLQESQVQQEAVSLPPSLGPDDYRYDPTGKRDPFKMFRPVSPKTADTSKSTLSIEPLQRWELEKLQVVGILWDVRTPRAMVRDPDGAVYTVIKNSKIGRNEGYVAAIREGEIVIFETKYDEGKSLKQTRVMELKK